MERPRQILHVDMDAFFVSVEELVNPSLAGKAVVVGGDPDGRGVVAAASYEARKYGIHSAMPLRTAKRLCPHAIFLHSDLQNYAAWSRRVCRVFERFTPDVQAVSIDEAYLDLTGTERLYGPGIAAAEQIKLEIKERVGLNASVGLATNKLVAKVASELAKPNGLCAVFPGGEAAFLAPLKIGRLPGVGAATTERLATLGVRRVGQLARLDKDLLERTFGSTGVWLHERANGIDPSPIETRGLPKSISRETTFDEDTADLERMERTLFRLVERVGRALRKEKLQAKTITLKLRYSDFSTVTRSVTFGEGTDLDAVIYDHVKALFRKAYTRRGRVRLLGAGTSNFVSAAWQPPLVVDDLDVGKLKSLYKAIDKVRDRFGTDALRVGKEEDDEGEDEEEE
jgi:DNA polymerase-4